MDSIANGPATTSADGRFDTETPARITAPADGTVIALDPDIPPRHQRLRLEAEGRGQALHWRIDGTALARGTSAQWLPWPGRHVVTLVDAQGRVLDSRRIEVRGAAVKATAGQGPRGRPADN